MAARSREKRGEPRPLGTDGLRGIHQLAAGSFPRLSFHPDPRADPSALLQSDLAPSQAAGRRREALDLSGQKLGVTDPGVDHPAGEPGEKDDAIRPGRPATRWAFRPAREPPPAKPFRRP